MKITRVYTRAGRHYYLQDLAERNPKTGRPRQKWHPLTRVIDGEAALLDALRVFKAQGETRIGNMATHLAAFRAAHLPTLSHDVKREYERMYDVVAEAFTDFDVADVTPADVLQFLNDNFAGHPTARRHYKARLSTFFAWCVLGGLLQVNPCREIRLKAPPKRKGRLTAPLFWAIHDELTPMGKVFLELLHLTRQRPTEIRLLRESAIGPTHIRFRPTKTEHSSGEEVEIRITPEIRAALERARELRPKGGKIAELARRRDPHVITTRDGDGYSKNGLYELWRDAIDACEAKGLRVKGITTRDVRPFALAAMEAAGYDLREIQRSAAHATISTTEGYLEQHRSRTSEAVIHLPGKE